MVFRNQQDPHSTVNKLIEIDLFCCLSVFSALITALIVSSDTLNVVKVVSISQKNDVPTHEIPPTESDKNHKQVISESKIETINVNLNKDSHPNPNPNNKVINSDNVAENLNLEFWQQKDQVPESDVIVQSKIGAADQQEDTNYVEDSIEIDENDDKA